MMKGKWMPAALAGTLGIGYLAGTQGGGVRDEVRVIPVPPAPVVVVAPAIAAPSPDAAPRSIPPVEAEPPVAPVFDPPPERGLGEYPAWNGVDLDCRDVGHPVRVTGPDPHDLDRDGDGIGCDG